MSIIGIVFLALQLVVLYWLFAGSLLIIVYIIWFYRHCDRLPGRIVGFAKYGRWFNKVVEFKGLDGVVRTQRIKVYLTKPQKELIGRQVNLLHLRNNNDVVIPSDFIALLLLWGCFIIFGIIIFLGRNYQRPYQPVEYYTAFGFWAISAWRIKFHYILGSFFVRKTTASSQFGENGNIQLLKDEELKQFT